MHRRRFPLINDHFNVNHSEHRSCVTVHFKPYSALASVCLCNFWIDPFPEKFPQVVILKAFKIFFCRNCKRYVVFAVCSYPFWKQAWIFRPLKNMKMILVYIFNLKIIFNFFKKVICTPDFDTFFETASETKYVLIFCISGGCVRNTWSRRKTRPTSRRHFHCNGSFLNLN